MSNNFAENLVKLRTSAKLTQQRLADILGLKDSTIVAYEKGRVTPSLEVVEKLADIFNISIDQLLGRNEQPVQTIGEFEALMNVCNTLPPEKKDRLVKYLKAIMEDFD